MIQIPEAGDASEFVAFPVNPGHCLVLPGEYLSVRVYRELFPSPPY